MTTHAPQPGCYLDSHRGHYIVVEIIKLAEGYGRKLDDAMAGHIALYEEHSHEAAYPHELVTEESDAAIQWLNDHVTLDGHIWEWNEGDFGLYPLDDEDEPTFRIERHYADESHPDNRKVILTGLTRDEAQEHCNRLDSREEGVWFDGWTEE